MSNPHLFGGFYLKKTRQNPSSLPKNQEKFNHDAADGCSWWGAACSEGLGSWRREVVSVAWVST